MHERLKTSFNTVGAAMICLSVTLLPGFAKRAQAQSHAHDEFPITGLATYMNTSPTMATIEARLAGKTASSLDESCLQGVDGYVALFGDHINEQVVLADAENGQILGTFCVTDTGAIGDRPYLRSIGFAADIWPREIWESLSSSKQVIVYDKYPIKSMESNKNMSPTREFTIDQADVPTTFSSNPVVTTNKTQVVSETTSIDSIPDASPPQKQARPSRAPLQTNKEIYTQFGEDGKIHNSGKSTISWNKQNKDGTFQYFEETNPVPEGADFVVVE